MKAALGLGSNLGPRRRTLERTVRNLRSRQGIEVLAVSRWLRTPPMRGGSARGWFLNGVVLVSTALPPRALLDACIALEEAADRRRAKHWGDRSLDLDILLVEDTVVHSEVLTVPHPAITTRRFVLEPLLEVWPDVRDPRDGSLLRDLPRAPGPRPVPVGRVAPERTLRYL